MLRKINYKNRECQYNLQRTAWRALPFEKCSDRALSVNAPGMELITSEYLPESLLDVRATPAEKFGTVLSATECHSPEQSNLFVLLGRIKYFTFS